MEKEIEVYIIKKIQEIKIHLEGIVVCRGVISVKLTQEEKEGVKGELSAIKTNVRIINDELEDIMRKLQET